MARNWDKISITIHNFDSFFDEKVYTMSEMSEITKLSVQTFARWHRNGKFKAREFLKNNRKYLYYTESDLNWFLKSDLYNNTNMVKNRDLIGQKIGKLTILDYSEEAKSKGYYGSYLCKCDCGTILTLPRSQIISKVNPSCGCKYEDLTNRDFGNWHVNYLEGIRKTPGGTKLFIYNCTCKCGENRSVIGSSLQAGTSLSCGCLKLDNAMSKAEFCVAKYLNSIGIYEYEDGLENYFIQNKSFSNLRGLGGGYLSYDFFIKYNEKIYLIECQGGQHYFPLDLWGGEEVFEKQKEHDKRKQEYAKNNNMILIEIPYNLFDYKKIVSLLKNYF